MKCKSFSTSRHTLPWNGIAWRSPLYPEALAFNWGRLGNKKGRFWLDCKYEVITSFEYCVSLDRKQTGTWSGVGCKTLYFFVGLCGALGDTDSFQLKLTDNYWIFDVGVVQDGESVSNAVATDVSSTVIGQTHHDEFLWNKAKGTVVINRDRDDEKENNEGSVAKSTEKIGPDSFVV